jgi:hypothetical protein
MTNTGPARVTAGNPGSTQLNRRVHHLQWTASVIGVVVCAGTVSEGWGQTVTPSTPSAGTSAYCSSGSSAFTISDEQGLSETTQKCRPGDTILIPGASTGAIAKVCDFSRTIVSTAGSVLCVVASQRSKR